MLIFQVTGLISIHTLRMEGDGDNAGDAGKGVISIHTLRMEGDGLKQKNGYIIQRISIHTLRMEGDMTGQ